MHPCGSTAHLSVQFVVSRQHVEVKRVHKHESCNYIQEFNCGGSASKMRVNLLLKRQSSHHQCVGCSSIWLQGNQKMNIILYLVLV